MQTIDGFGFYNGGRAADASQHYKYLQYIPLAVSEPHADLPIAALIRRHISEVETHQTVPTLPFSHSIRPLAIAHFLNFGHRENRDPSAFFDSGDYLLKNPDVKAAVDGGALDSAFEHFIEFGAEEGRLNGLLFEEAFYLQQNPDVAAAVQSGGIASGLSHFISFGQSEGRPIGSV